MADPQKLVIMATHGPEEAELATIPFVMANAALASGIEVVMGFQADGVRLAHEGEVDKVEALEFPPLRDLLADYRELGGRLLVCGPCLKAREIPADALTAGAEVVGAAVFVAEIAAATNSLVY